MNVAAQSPKGPQEGVPTRFTWHAEGVEPPFTFVLLGAGYDEMVRVGGIGGTSFTPDRGVAAVLATGGTFHWFVAGKAGARLCRSPLQTVEIR